MPVQLAAQQLVWHIIQEPQCNPGILVTHME
jgi:hypothetical protein